MAQGVERTEEAALELVESLKPLLILGISLKNSCIETKIDYTSILNYIKKWESVSTRIEGYMATVKRNAEKNVAEAIMDNDKDMTKWYLEHKHRDEYNKKLTGENNNKTDANITVNINKNYGDKHRPTAETD